MGYIYMMATCCNCKVVISFNPNKVPSLMINGTRQPLCKACANRWNELHPDNARPILEGAYDPADENEVNWS